MKNADVKKTIQSTAKAFYLLEKKGEQNMELSEKIVAGSHSWNFAGSGKGRNPERLCKGASQGLADYRPVQPLV